MTFNDLAMQALTDILTHIGEDVDYQHGEDSPEVIRGVYNERHQAIDAGIVVSSAQPNLLIKLADLSEPPDTGDQVSLRGRTFKVVNVENDGEGGAVLYLNEMDQE